MSTRHTFKDICMAAMLIYILQQLFKWSNAMSLFSLSECIYLRATKVMARKWCFVNMKYNFMMSKSNLISISDYKMVFHLGDWLIELLKSGQLCTCVWLLKHQWFKSFGNVSGILQQNRNSSLTFIRFTIITEGFDLSKKGSGIWLSCFF